MSQKNFVPLKKLEIEAGRLSGVSRTMASSSNLSSDELLRLAESSFVLTKGSSDGVADRISTDSCFSDLGEELNVGVLLTDGLRVTNEGVGVDVEMEVSGGVGLGCIGVAEEIRVGFSASDDGFGKTEGTGVELISGVGVSVDVLLVEPADTTTSSK